MPKVVIIDAQGDRHVFPEGFDPVKAAGIVREQTAPKPVSSNEPDTYLGGYLKGGLEGMEGGAKGFFKGVIPGAVGAVTGAIPAVVKAGVATLKGGANLIQDPEGTLKAAWETVKGIPGMSANTAQDLMSLAARDPEAFGKAVGELTGSTEVGIAAIPGLKALPAGAGRVAGRTIEEIGKHGKWPIRMMGAHQLGSGNPMGLATMAMPEALSKSGRAIRLASTPAGAVAGELPTRFLELEQDIKAGKPDVAARLDALQTELVDARTAAKVPEQVTAIQKQQNQLNRLQKMVTKASETSTEAAPPAAESEADMLRKAGFDPNKVVSSTPGAKKGAVSASTGNLVKVASKPTGPVAAPTSAPVASSAAPGPSAPVQPPVAPTGNLSPFDQFLADNPPGEGRTTGQFPEGPGGLKSVADQSMGPKPYQGPSSIMADMEESYGHGPRPEPPPTVEGSSTGRPGELPPPGLTVGEIPPPTGMTEPGQPSMDALMANRLDAASRSMGIRPSRTKGGTVSGPFSSGDMAALKDILENNPGIDLETAQLLLEQARGQRGSAYRISAAMDKGGMQ